MNATSISDYFTHFKMSIPGALCILCAPR